MNKETKDFMAVRQHIEAAANAAKAYYKEDDENRDTLDTIISTLKTIEL